MDCWVKNIAKTGHLVINAALGSWQYPFNVEATIVGFRHYLIRFIGCIFIGLWPSISSFLGCLSHQSCTEVVDLLSKY